MYFDAHGDYSDHYQEAPGRGRGRGREPRGRGSRGARSNGPSHRPAEDA
ncbi:unnamed protein product [Rhodiola kirilowii]